MEKNVWYFVLGTEHEECIVRENYYAVSDNQVYYYGRPINDAWNILVEPDIMQKKSPKTNGSVRGHGLRKPAIGDMVRRALSLTLHSYQKRA